MDRVQFENRNVLHNGELVCSYLSCALKKDINIEIKQSEIIDLLIDNFEKEQNLNILVNDGARINVSILAKSNVNNSKITAKLANNSQISIFFADFTSGDNKMNINIDLDKENAKCDWHLSSLTSGKDSKEFAVFINHNHPLTFATSNNYGVCKDDGKLVFAGTSSIKKGCKGSNTQQNAKIMVFDEKSTAVAKPILKIDENDLLASHSAVVGKINDEHLFYLTSRGLSDNEAKELITYGYLKPICEGFLDKNIKEEIIKLIEDKM